MLSGVSFHHEHGGLGGRAGSVHGLGLLGGSRCGFRQHHRAASKSNASSRVDPAKWLGKAAWSRTACSVKTREASESSSGEQRLEPRAHGTKLGAVHGHARTRLAGRERALERRDQGVQRHGKRIEPASIASRGSRSRTARIELGGERRHLHRGRWCRRTPWSCGRGARRRRSRLSRLRRGSRRPHPSGWRRTSSASTGRTPSFRSMPLSAASGSRPAMPAGRSPAAAAGSPRAPPRGDMPRLHPLEQHLP